MKLAPLLLGFLVACGGGSGDGDPIDGTVVITVGSDTITPTVGAAVVDAEDDSSMVIMIGTDDISCATDFDSTRLSGTTFFATIPQMTGTHDTLGWVARSNSFNGSTATVIVDGLSDRVSGSIEFDTTDEDDGEITVTGTYDVISCL